MQPKYRETLGDCHPCFGSHVPGPVNPEGQEKLLFHRLAQHMLLLFSGKLTLVVCLSLCYKQQDPFFSTTCQANLCLAEFNTCIEHDMNQH